MSMDDNPTRREDETGPAPEVRFRSPPPAKIDEWTRYIKHERTLNDYVEDVHRVLWDESPEYRAFLSAVDDSESIEGSLGDDNSMAARMLRDKAEVINNREVAKRKLATIRKSLGVVLRRYHVDRKRRKNTVGGEYVPPETPDNGVSNG